MVAPAQDAEWVKPSASSSLVGIEPTAGRYFYLVTAALSIVGYEHGPHDPVGRLWNDCHHAGDDE
jgi:hypothetical protein